MHKQPTSKNVRATDFDIETLSEYCDCGVRTFVDADNPGSHEPECLGRSTCGYEETDRL